MDYLAKIPYGSHLYGTNTPTSDWDFKAIYLPAFDDVLLGKKHHITKIRVNANGVPVPDKDKMPDGGIETELIPLQTFARDFLDGQTYALEVAFAIDAGIGTFDLHIKSFVRQLISRFLTCNIYSMASFAQKQTFDYAHRGVRLEKARTLLSALDHLQYNRGSFTHVPLDKAVRLDHTTTPEGGQKVIHFLAKMAKLELGSTVNNGTEMETLKLNGRDYLETTAVGHLWTAVKKLIDSYGERTKSAAENEVDPKSLMHAVRVYQQSLELLQTGRITFPRTNVDELLSIKRLEKPLEDTKELLLQLEDAVTSAEETSKLLPEKTPELQKRFDDWLVSALKDWYGLSCAA